MPTDSQDDPNDIIGATARRLKEVKVKIPVRFHVKLHSMKVLTGQEISATVTNALNEYFRAMEESGRTPSGFDLKDIMRELGAPPE